MAAVNGVAKRPAGTGGGGGGCAEAQQRGPAGLQGKVGQRGNRRRLRDPGWQWGRNLRESLALKHQLLQLLDLHASHVGQFPLALVDVDGGI